MEYKDFEKHITRIIDCYDRETQLCQLLKAEGPISMSDYLVDSLIDLLALRFDDTNEWINYWMWELDFGKKYRPGMVLVDGKEVHLKTINDLWNILK